MAYRVAADSVVVFHVLFVLFVTLGGLLVWRWPRLAWLHLPAAIWGALVEETGLVCPLTTLEEWLRGRAGIGAYPGGFIEHYLVPVLYPAGLTRGAQVVLGGCVVALNLAVYVGLWQQRRRSHEG